MMNKLIPILLAAAALAGCKTNQLYLNVLEPAPVTISPGITKVGVINRSTPTDDTKVFDILDKALTLEGVNLDKDGAEKAMAGLSSELLNNQRFAEVKPLTDYDFRTPKLGLFPDPLSWEIVDKICRETETQALFSLEAYDTDTRLNYSTRNVNIKGPLGVTIPGLEHRIDMETIVKTGWRIYDPATRTIDDEYTDVQSIIFNSHGINPLAAAKALTGRKSAVQQVSAKSGQEYALRIVPFTLRVQRDYFVKGTDNFKIAKRKAQLGKWDEAGQLWEKETGNSKMKIAGRACYNMAIISEIDGDVPGALKWAQKAYEDYNIKQAREYSRILENRKMKLNVIDEQQK
jgi:hypothetical protein